MATEEYRLSAKVTKQVTRPRVTLGILTIEHSPGQQAALPCAGPVHTPFR